ncbi:hypothetical protein RSOLAG1IB_07741 [Rhizoctonia solani AG-1 IB]|uniref:Transmembrane protein n=1 Tax=Thanatephorus cucumeris (strain AG1-IB / isolate 7/3/14) TaxID=1108050 RepID=A0A0B7FFF2_THACB|nr:hypothetical protein RSOLAG1IB_07741 [Rhizoctonia solani AG-1 IB]
MLVFTRLATILFFVLSLGFVVSALPTAASDSNELVARDGSNDLKTLVINLKADVDVCINTIGAILSVVTQNKPNINIAGLTASADVSAQIDVLVGKINTCATAVLALGSNIDINASVQADVAVKVGAIITAIVQLGLSLSAKFGSLVALGLFAKIDVCLAALLTNLNICVGGIISLITKAVGNISVNIFANIHLGLCAHVLGLINP